MENKRQYLANVCNFLNNTKGELEDFELRFLLEFVCGNRIYLDMEKQEKYLNDLSDFVASDNEDRFVDYLFELGGIYGICE